MNTIVILIGMAIAVGLFIAVCADNNRQPVVDTIRAIFAVIVFFSLAPLLVVTL